MLRVLLRQFVNGYAENIGNSITKSIANSITEKILQPEQLYLAAAFMSSKAHTERDDYWSAQKHLEIGEVENSLPILSA